MHILMLVDVHMAKLMQTSEKCAFSRYEATLLDHSEHNNKRRHSVVSIYIHYFLRYNNH